jgi:glycosyltransferase involved in cell wall biosynthesis
VCDLKLGAFVYEPEKAAGFDFHLLRTKIETGDRIPPVRDMYSNVAVFADNAAVRSNPDWISQSPFGPAQFGNNNFNIYWSVVCATQPEHRAEQLDYIEDVDRRSMGVWLNSQYFADHGHCTCPRCKERWKKSGLGWLEWRRQEVTDYMAQIRKRVKKELVMSIQPDPVTSLERYGVDFDDFAKYADAFNVVMFSKNYATPWYWEMLARGFKKLLKKPVYISLYVYGPGDTAQDVPSASELLTVSVRCARTGIDGILYLANGAIEMRDFQKAAVEKAELRKRLESYGGQPVQEVLDWVKNWEKILG